MADLYFKGKSLFVELESPYFVYMYVSSNGDGSGESAQKPPMFDDVMRTKGSNDGSYILLQLRLINPFMPNVLPHLYQLNESVSNFRVVGWYFSF